MQPIHSLQPRKVPDMKCASFIDGNRHSWGVVEGDYIFDVGATAEPSMLTLRKALAQPSAAQAISVAATAAQKLKLSDVALDPVIPDPDKIICVGLNYENHRKETGRDAVQYPTLFTRFANSQVGHNAPLVRPRASTHLDYEGELAVVIGRPGRHISKERAIAHVAGYSCYNDVSVRDWQRHTIQFTPGKNFVGTGPFGPYLVTPDEVGPLAELKLVTRLNGQVVQETTLGDMIFDIPTIIAYCSAFTRLEIGDVIVTGTPGGVGAKRSPPLWMKPGDLVEVQIDRIGHLRNTVVDEVILED
jgi:2-keto-4-pentenoate hydratase/2-oxohepta-3-ene-1,7-dioic acid hydratase in catechol pathway